MSPKVSVVSGSSRPGGLDIMLRGIADQTFADFEFILVDWRYHLRHERVLEFAKDIGLKVPFYHVPNHRYNKYWSVLAAGWNTGFMLAEGEIVIMLLDYSYAPPNWIENHLKYHLDGQKRLVMSPHVYKNMPTVVTKNAEAPKIIDQTDRSVYEDPLDWNNFDEISIFESLFTPSWLSKLEEYQYPHRDPKLDLPTGRIGYTYMHMKNESFPLDTVLKIGGIDENFDRGKGPMDNEFGFRFMQAGCELWLTQDARVYCLNPRFILSSRPWGDLEKRVEGRWSYRDGERYQNLRYVEMQSGKPPISNNPYDMFERRKEIWCWRELSQEQKPLIPRNDVLDDVWFKNNLWMCGEA